MACTVKHKTFEIPTDPEGKARYESAMRHVALAKEQGKSPEEIHELFHKVMTGTGKCGAKKD